MSMLIPLAHPCTPRGQSQATTEALRRRALDRLYERRNVVDSLIQSLEDYQRNQSGRAPCIEITARERCWSDSAQSQI